MITILKKLFFTGNERETAAPASQTSRQSEDNEKPQTVPPGGTDMSELERTETSSEADKVDKEEQEPPDEAGTAGDPRQTTPLKPAGDAEQSLWTSSLKRKRIREKGKQALHVVERSDVGAIRDRNEDACFAFCSQSGGHAPMPLFGLFVVADGMGGHFDGHKASEIVSRTFAGHVLDRLYLPLVQGNEGPRPPIQEVMEEAVHRANQALHMPDPEKKMGTTLTAALIFGNRLFLVHVGDSRAYLLTEREGLQPVTTDHSFVQALQDAGQLTAEEAATHPDRNLLYRALMGEELETIDVFTQSLPERGVLVLCSDGLWGLIATPDMERVLAGEQPLPEKADELVNKALVAGGHDNITVVLVDFKF